MHKFSAGKGQLTHQCSFFFLGLLDEIQQHPRDGEDGVHEEVVVIFFVLGGKAKTRTN